MQTTIIPYLFVVYYGFTVFFLSPYILLQNRIADDQVFTCEPRAGQLAVGETVRLQLTYAHRLAGIHEVSAILQVQRGTRWRNVRTVRLQLTCAH